MAVVLAQAALEVCTEWAFTVLFALRGVEKLTKSVLDLFLSTNICNERVRKVYEGLSGDTLADHQFWTRLMSHKKLRNAVVHEGKKTSADEAADFVALVDEYIRHVETVVQNLQEKQGATA
jgi:hypothetical protein